MTATVTPASVDDGTPVWRRLDMVAMVVQVEAAILLLSPAITLLVRRELPNPAPALIALVLGPILWRLGHGIANASRAAIGVMAFLVLFHFAAVIGPRRTAVDVVVICVEVVAVIAAFVAMRKYQPPVRSAWNKELIPETAFPIGLAVVWAVFALGTVAGPGADDHVVSRLRAARYLALIMIGTAIWLAVSTRLPGRIYRAVISDEPSWPGNVNWSAAPLLDFIVAALIGPLSWWSLAWFLRGTDQPGVMLSLSMLFFPAASLFGLGVTAAWFLSGCAHYAEWTWARRARLVAVIGTGFLFFLVAPVAFDFLKAFLRGR